MFTYTSLYKELSTCKGSFKDSEKHARACRGSFLFLDLPDLMPNMTHGLPDDVSRDFVLFTAHDVLFLKDVDSCKVGSPKVCGFGCVWMCFGFGCVVCRWENTVTEHLIACTICTHTVVIAGHSVCQHCLYIETHLLLLRESDA